AEVGQHLVNNSQSPGAIAGLAPPPVDISSRRQWRSTAHVVFIAKLPGHLAAGPELPQRHGARSQGQNREIRNGGSLPGSDSREGARSKRRKAAAGDGEGAYMDVRDRAGFGENAAPRRLSPRPAPQMYPSFMDAAMPLASLPVQIAGRNRYFRRMVTDSIKDSPDYDGGEYKHPPLGLRGAFYALAFMTSSPKDWQREMPTQALADAGFDRMLARDFRAYDATRGGRAVGTVGQVGAEGCEIHAVADRPRQTTGGRAR